jgi:serine/threonine protein phosphatase 1
MGIFDNWPQSLANAAIFSKPCFSAETGALRLIFIGHGSGLGFEALPIVDPAAAKVLVSDRMKGVRETLTATPSAKHRRLAGWFQRKRPQPARAPEGERVYVIGDIHGRADLLDKLLARVLEHAWSGPEKRTLIYVGDYVDRGADSRGVIERLLQPIPKFTTRFLRGNHDQAVLDFLSDPLFYRIWKSYGAQETLLSYGVRPPRFDEVQAITEARDEFAAKLPPAHLAFFEALEMSAEVGDYFIAHAGVRPGVALDAQAKEDLLWIRDDFLFSNSDFGKVIVHGHTPSDDVVRRKNRIGVDTGAYATGHLTALVLEGDTTDFLQT